MFHLGKKNLLYNKQLLKVQREKINQIVAKIKQVKSGKAKYLGLKNIQKIQKCKALRIYRN